MTARSLAERVYAVQSNRDPEALRLPTDAHSGGRPGRSSGGDLSQYGFVWLVALAASSSPAWRTSEDVALTSQHPFPA